MKIGIVLGSLPTYFPQKYNVFERVLKTINTVCQYVKIDYVQAPNIPMNATQTQEVLQYFRQQGVGFVLLVHGGFTMGDVAREIAMSDFQSGIWATCEPTLEGDVQLNNFVSLNMSMSIFHQNRNCEAIPVEWFYGDPEDKALQNELCYHLQALKLKSTLQMTKIGLIGGVAPTFYNMHVSQSHLKEKLGIEVCDVDMHRLLNAMECADPKDIDSETQNIISQVNVQSLSSEQLEKTVRCVLALRSIIQEDSYDALAVSDWPVLQQNPYCMHPGGAFSLLEHNDGIPIASEGDVLGAVTQMIVKKLTGRVGCILDMTLPQFDKNRILIWHGGGGALSYAKNGAVSLVPHPMIGRGTDQEGTYGAIADFEFEPDTYGLLRISEHGRSLWAVEGEIQNSLDGETGYVGCRGWMSNFKTVDEDYHAKDIVHSIMEYGIEHHFILADKGLLPILSRFAKWCNLQHYQISK